jgi:hypothetical protein
MLKYLLDYTDKLWTFCFAIVYLTSCEEDVFYICENADELFIRLYAIELMSMFMMRLMIKLIIHIIVNIVGCFIVSPKKYLMKCKLLYNRLTTVKYIRPKIKLLFENSIHSMCPFKILL